MPAIAPLRLPMDAPDDLGVFEAMLDDGSLPAENVVALWCKTCGNGLLNDFTKPWVDLLLRLALARRLGCSAEEVAARLPILVSGGAEGAISPHLVVWRRGRGGARGLLGQTARAEIAGADQGGEAHGAATARMVRQAMAGLDPGDVGLVLVRAPSPAGAEAQVRRAVAQGVAEALDEPGGHARCAFVVARHDGPMQQVMLLANGPGGDPRFAIASGPLADPLDSAGGAAVLARLGLEARPQLRDPGRVVAAIAKGDAPGGGRLRGLPHAMARDSDVAMHRHARAAYGAMLGALIGHGAVLVSAGAEGQGQPDGGFVSIVARTEDPPA